MRGPSPDDPTIGRLVADATRDISSLVSKEIELAKSELKVSVQAGGMGIGLLAGAAFIAVLGVIMLSFTIVYFIHWAGLGLHWSYLIVTGFWFLMVALLGFIGVRSSSRSAHPRRPSSRAVRSPRRFGASWGLARASLGRLLGVAGAALVRGVADLVRGERVAGVVVGHRRREHHAGHLPGRVDDRAAGVAGPDQPADREDIADHRAVTVDVRRAKGLLGADPAASMSNGPSCG